MVPFFLLFLTLLRPPVAAIAVINTFIAFICAATHYHHHHHYHRPFTAPPRKRFGGLFSRKPKDKTKKEDKKESADKPEAAANVDLTAAAIPPSPRGVMSADDPADGPRKIGHRKIDKVTGEVAYKKVKQNKKKLAKGKRNGGKGQDKAGKKRKRALITN